MTEHPYEIPLYVWRCPLHACSWAYTDTNEAATRRAMLPGGEIHGHIEEAHILMEWVQEVIDLRGPQWPVEPYAPGGEVKGEHADVLANLLLLSLFAPTDGPEPSPYSAPTTGGAVDWDKMIADMRAADKPQVSPYRDHLRRKAAEAQREEEDRLPSHGRNTRIGCEQYDSGTWIHGRPHNCPRNARG
jgi:hypothetical protein